MKFGPASFRRLLVGMIPIPTVRRFKEVVDVMDETANRVYWKKKEAVSKLLKEEGNAEAMKELKDVMSLTRESPHLYLSRSKRLTLANYVGQWHPTCRIRA